MLTRGNLRLVYTQAQVSLTHSVSLSLSLSYTIALSTFRPRSDTYITTQHQSPHPAKRLAYRTCTLPPIAALDARPRSRLGAFLPALEARCFSGRRHRVSRLWCRL